MKGALHGSNDGVLQVRITFNPILCTRGSIKSQKRESKSEREKSRISLSLARGLARRRVTLERELMSDNGVTLACRESAALGVGTAGRTDGPGLEPILALSGQLLPPWKGDDACLGGWGAQGVRPGAQAQALV